MIGLKRLKIKFLRFSQSIQNMQQKKNHYENLLYLYLLSLVLLL
jgi:hypothetical protein